MKFKINTKIAASIYANYSGTEVGIVGGSEEEMAYFKEAVAKKRVLEKKEEELRNKRKENEKKIKERYRKFLNRMLKDRLLNLTPNDDIRTLIIMETNKWLKKII